MSTRRMRDSFKYLDGILHICNSCGGFKDVSKPSWRRANQKTWQHIVSNTFKWILMMVVSKLKKIG